MESTSSRTVVYVGTCPTCETDIQCHPREVSGGWGGHGPRFATCPRCGHSVQVSKECVKEGQR